MLNSILPDIVHKLSTIKQQLTCPKHWWRTTGATRVVDADFIATYPMFKIEQKRQKCRRCGKVRWV